MLIVAALLMSLVVLPAGAVGAAVVADPTDGTIELPTAAGVEAVAVPVTGPDARPLTSPRIAVDAAPGVRSFEASPGFGATVTVPAGEMIGAEWTGAPTGSVQVRARTPKGWTGWSDLAGDPDEGPDATSPESRAAGHTAVGPIWTGSGTSAVQVQVTSGRLSDLRIQVLRTSGPAAPALDPDAGRSAASADPRASDFIARRAAWGAGPWQSNTPGCGTVPPTSPLKHAVVHHTAGSNTYAQSEVDDVLRGIYYFHIQTQGWCDIAYNFLVDRFGGMWEGRTNSLNGPVIGGHAKGFNTGSVGVSLMGDFEAGSLPAAAFAGVRRIVAWRLADAGIDPGGWLGVVSGGSTRYPAGQTVLMNRINSHQTTSLTACPGKDVLRRMGELRSAVTSDVLRLGPFDRLSGYHPQTGVPAVQVLDGWGGIHPAGSGVPVAEDGWWSGWSIARGIAGTASEGYVVDGFGGLHPYGTAPPAAGSAYWNGIDFAVGVSRGPGRGSGYVLDAFGGVHPFGSAAGVNPAPRWNGWRIARDIVSTNAGGGGYVLDGLGGLHAFGNAPHQQTPVYWANWDIARAVALRPDGPGGYLLDGLGGLHHFGGAPPVMASHYTPHADSNRDIVLLPGNRGYVLDVDGYVWPFGGAPSIASTLSWPGTGLSGGLVAG
jgi:hypothetical protein